MVLDRGVRMSIYETSITNPKKQLEFYKQLSEQLQQENKKYKEVINKAIEFIEKEYYSKNTVAIDSIGITTNKLLQVRKILKEVSE